MDLGASYTEATLCLPLDGEGRLLLGKKTKKIGVNRRNGPGGSIEPGESRRMCVARECKEELDIIVDPHALEHVAVIDFYNQRSDDSVFRVRVWIYIARGWTGIPTAISDEMNDPRIYPLSAIPFDEMMPGDNLWMPEVLLEGRIVLGEFHYGPDQQYLVGDPILADLPDDIIDR